MKIGATKIVALAMAATVMTESAASLPSGVANGAGYMKHSSIDEELIATANIFTDSSRHLGEEEESWYNNYISPITTAAATTTTTTTSTTTTTATTSTTSTTTAATTTAPPPAPPTQSPALWDDYDWGQAQDEPSYSDDWGGTYSSGVAEYDSWYWVGDSRTVGLSYFYDISYTAKVGCGINYFIQNSAYVYDLRGYNIVFNLGVNDLGNIWDYIYLYNNMPEDFISGNNIIVMSVNPCNGGYSYLNSQIADFNTTMQDNLREDITFLDSYNYLQNIGFTTTDGLHYTSNTYIDIYNFVTGN